ncbi:transaldolase family protein [Candidatus Carsonella ruddii]|uniref:transaldolase n=1 Tax=Candidatus Carsonella ruddii PC isolate NHV TaxID=1202540 RepID=J3VQW5_CARRU|nr:transaldolase family protein [Candidatus Carsonella ruddii]AFP84341.1 transaldolase [Candidatus Carsonella ruddii PC isolate NHV]
MKFFDFIKNKTKISIDSADINFIKNKLFNAATTNPSLILKSILSKVYNKLLYAFLLKNFKKKIIDSDYNISLYDKLLVNIIANIIPYIKEKISIEIPARISFNYNKIIFYSYKIIYLCEKIGINLKKILIKIPATNSGIKAAKQLKNNNINSNLTLIFNLTQAKKCFDSGIYIISPFVGRVSDSIYCKYDSGVNFVKNLVNLKNNNNYSTKIMAASFRNINQIINLTCCDFITISPIYYNKLKNINYKNSVLNYKSNIDFCNNENYNSIKLLNNGIKQFDIDHNRLIKLISNLINNL